jgi:hypothetical protein
LKRGGDFWSDLTNLIGNKKPLREGLTELNTIISKKDDIYQRVNYYRNFDNFKDAFANSRNSLQTASFTNNEKEIEKLYQFDKFLFYSVYEKLIHAQGKIEEHIQLIEDIKIKKKDHFIKFKEKVGIVDENYTIKTIIGEASIDDRGYLVYFNQRPPIKVENKKMRPILSNLLKYLKNGDDSIVKSLEEQPKPQSYEDE